MTKLDGLYVLVEDIFLLLDSTMGVALRIVLKSDTSRFMSCPVYVEVKL